MGLVRLLVAVLTAWTVLGPVGSQGVSRAQISSNVATADAPSALPPDVRPPTDAESALDRENAANAEVGKIRGDSRATEQALRSVLTVREATWGPRHPITGLALNDLAANLDDQGRAGEAEPLQRRALEIYQTRLGPQHVVTAMGLNGLGTILEAQGRLADAEPFYRSAIAISERGSATDNAIGLASLFNLATNLENQGRLEEAEALFRRTLTMTEAGGGSDNQYAGMSLNALASNLEVQGRTVDAEQLHRRSLKISETQLGIGHPETAWRVIDLARNLEAQGRVVEAEPLYRRALAINETRLGSDHPDTATSLTALALDLTVQHRNADAERLFKRVLAVYETRLGPDHPSTATALGNVAGNALSQGRVAEAVELNRRATAIWNSRLGSDHPDIASIRSGLSHGYLEHGRADLALVEARAALRTWDGIAATANAAAPNATRAAMIRDRSFGAALVMRSAWRAASSATAPELFAEAFDAAQRLQISAASDALAQGAARTAASQAGAGNAVADWRAAQQVLARIDSQISSAAKMGAEGDAQRLRLAEERTHAVATLAETQRDLSISFPRYFDLIRAPPVAVADLQASTGDDAKLLRADEALVVLTPGASWMPEGERKGLVFVVTETASAWAEIPLDPGELEREVSALHKDLNDAATTAAAPAPFHRKPAQALYRALFGAPNIAAVLSGKDRWILAPQGALMSLPYATLVMTPPRGNDSDVVAMRRTAWLGLTKTLAVVPSVSALRLQRLYALAPGVQQRTPFFGLGDPAFQGVADTGTRGGVISGAQTYFRGASADLSQLARLPRLPGTAAEIRGLAESFGGGHESYVLQVDATEAELRRRNASGALGGADIVAFATHGLLAGDLTFLAEPALALTPPVLEADAHVNPDDDGLLTASEAATLQLSANFVILSACNTAAGGGPDADSLSGLARAFLYAGAKSLLVSHYPIFDDAGMRLTTEAARIARATGVRNPEAMRQSMALLMSDTSADAGGRSFAHPVNWAPFAVIDAN